MYVEELWGTRRLLKRKPLGAFSVVHSSLVDVSTLALKDLTVLVQVNFAHSISLRIREINQITNRIRVHILSVTT